MLFLSLLYQSEEKITIRLSLQGFSTPEYWRNTIFLSFKVYLSLGYNKNSLTKEDNVVAYNDASSAKFVKQLAVFYEAFLPLARETEFKQAS